MQEVLMRSIGSLSAALSVLALLALPVSGQEGDDGDAMISVQDGVYSEAQADRGEKVFEETCLSCHESGEFGSDYMEGWSGQTAEAFFDSLRSTMPQDNPSALKRREYADILAFLFSVNGLPPGEVDLKSSSRVLKRIRLEGPYGQAGGAPPSEAPKN
jgi:mono/diheme cytochrome c family protein